MTTQLFQKKKHVHLNVLKKSRYGGCHSLPYWELGPAVLWRQIESVENVKKCSKKNVKKKLLSKFSLTAVAMCRVIYRVKDPEWKKPAQGWV
jgi:hypothetical protein